MERRDSLLHAGVRDEALGYLTAGVSVDILGLKGSGRSLVVREVVRDLRRRDWTVLEVQGVAPLRSRPLEALSIAGLAARPEGRGESLVASSVRRVEERVSAGRSVLVVDDVDDIDDATAGVLTAVHARRPLPVLTTSRPLPAARLDPHRLPAEVRPGVSLPMPPLGYVDVHTLLSELLPGPIEMATVSRIYNKSGGLPGLVVAIAATARRIGALAVRDGVWAAGPDMWAPEVIRTVEPLLQDLSAEAREGLEKLALAGAVDMASARRMMPWEALEELEACSLLRVVPHRSGSLVGVFPQLLAERARHRALGPRRTRLTEDLVRAFGDMRDLPRDGRTELMTSAWQTGASEVFAPLAAPAETVPGDADTVLARTLHEQWHREVLIRRSEWERSPSAQTAVPYLRTLLHGEGDPRTIHEVIARTPPAAESRGRVGFASWHALSLGYVDRDLSGALDVLAEAEPDHGTSDPVLGALATHLTLVLDHAPQDGLPAPRDTGAEESQAVVTARAEVLVASGRPREALDLLATLHTGDSDLLRTRDVLIGIALVIDGRPAEALEVGRRALAESRTLLDLAGIQAHAYVVSYALLLLGRRTELVAHLGSVLSLGMSSTLQRPYQVANLSLASAVAGAVGRPTTARTLARDVSTLRLGPGPFSSTMPSWVVGGHGVEVLDARDGGGPLGDRLWAQCLDLLDRGYVAAGVAAGVDAIGLTRDPAWAAVLRERTDDVPAGLVQHLRRLAVALTEDDPDHALDLGVGLVADGEILIGAHALAAAVRGMRERDRPADAARALDRARALLAPHGSDALAVLDPLAAVTVLTDREEEIARRVARGMSNHELARELQISVRTVESHLHRIFRKLGVDSRADLTRVLND
ncbi:LuxR C-terminal-related transcriptional regulator [Isoptericola sp. NPDC056573]|uniref:helix-turn-helix transcriptional regulator n=1 Tax=Isoptericola sp. NPDC056573 TaxID=3345868 RepID=UPI0036CA6ADB